MARSLRAPEPTSHLKAFSLLCVLRALVKFLKLNFPSCDTRQQSLVPQYANYRFTPGLLECSVKGIQAMNTAYFHVSSPDRGRADKAELRLPVVHHICKNGIVVRNLQLRQIHPKTEEGHRAKLIMHVMSEPGHWRKATSAR